MSRDTRDSKPALVEEGFKEMNIKNGESSDEEAKDTIVLEAVKREPVLYNGTSNPASAKSAVQILKRNTSGTQSPVKAEGGDREVVAGEVTVKLEPGQPPKLARTPSKSIVARCAPTFESYEDKTEEATGVFQLFTECTYSAKYLGSTEHAMECDCAEEWDASAKRNHACGDDSDCINRATKMECFGDCGCGSDCQNQRFQRQEYADVTVIKTEKKGYGLRADSDLQPNDFIFEYIGEVINEAQFRRRMVQYDEEGIKHFYFMSLSKGEFVDATKKGNLGRFCNHSCNPNCYVDKWVVGDKLRMGIFAERKIKAGEELVFNYNVDRYGAEPQPCYCAEPNCTGFIGGKTQTERATKLSHTTIEALGIDDADGWDTAVAKKPRKKKVGEDDEEYVNNVEPKSLDEDGVTNVMATLMQCKEKWIAVKLLGRIQRCNDERVINRVVKMHGYQILNSALTTWKEDFNVVLQILDILNGFPRLTRNKINDSNIETTVSALEGCGDERVENQAAALLKEWSTLETAYRIPRKKRDPNSTNERHNHFERRESNRRSRSRSKSRSRSRSLDAPKGPAAPTGPRNNIPQRNAAFYSGGRSAFRPPRPFNGLPTGWFAATDNGRTYYYSAAGQTTWTRPTLPAAQPPPPPKPTSANKALDDIINEITSAKAKTPDKASATATPQATTDSSKKERKEGKEKWRSLPEEKQKKLYENTLFPHIRYVMDKFKNKIPKDELKKFAKEISKKLVNSDFKNHRVDDPTQISSKQEKQVKKYVKEFFDKVVAKRKAHEERKAEKKALAEGSAEVKSESSGGIDVKKEEKSDMEDGMQTSDDDGADIKKKPKSVTPTTPFDQLMNGDGLKRKRESEEGEDRFKLDDEEATPSKRARSDSPPTPPPPPPPPAEDMLGDPIMMDDSTSYDEEQLHNTSDVINGALTTNGEPAMVEEDMDDVDQLVPPPSPPKEQHGVKLKNDVVVSHNQLLSAVFGSVETPNGLEDTPPVEHDHSTKGIHPERVRFLKAQESM